MTVIPLHPGPEKAARSAHARVAPATYTVPEVAELLGVGTSTIYQMLRAGDIPARRAGDRWIISRRRIHAWLDGDDQGVTDIGNLATQSSGGAR
jgi:excisionase family DNA binding protein